MTDRAEELAAALRERWKIARDASVDKSLSLQECLMAGGRAGGLLDAIEAITAYGSDKAKEQDTWLDHENNLMLYGAGAVANEPSDLVKRLRSATSASRGPTYASFHSLAKEAADRIEALEAERTISENGGLVRVDDILALLPGGQFCDPQAIADGVRALTRHDRGPWAPDCVSPACPHYQTSQERGAVTITDDHASAFIEEYLRWCPAQKTP